MATITFSADDLAGLPALERRANQLDRLHEQAEQPGCPGLVHQHWFRNDGEGYVYELMNDMRENVRVLRRKFYDEGEMSAPEGWLVDELYRGILN